MRRIIALVAVLMMQGWLMQNSLWACAWDSDTLAAEAKGIPDVVRVITGRFERNPDLYYQLRLQRVTKELQADPTKLEAYDDAGVACDRLHRGDEAIAWMEKKRRQMDTLAAGTKVSKAALREHRYRYLANVGTFWAHSWLRAGADRKKIAQMKRARDYIKAAITLNPNAHFGREKYQLKAMEWIITQPVEKYDDGTIRSIPTILGDSWNIPQAQEAVKGLSGLIVLGDAWQSVDIFNGLKVAVQADGERSYVAHLAWLRCEELINQGKRSLHPRAPSGKKLAEMLRETDDHSLRNEPRLATQFRELRTEAESWHRHRTEYMMERLKLGRHPDTDPNFWSAYKELPAPPLYSGEDKPWWQERGSAFGIIGGGLLLSLLVLRFRRGSRRAATALR